MPTPDDQLTCPPTAPVHGALVPTCTPETQTIVWILEGNRAEDVADQIRQMYPAADVEHLLSNAANYFASVGNADAEVIRGWCLDATRELYRRMVESGDYVGALRAIKQLATLAKCSAEKTNPKTIEAQSAETPNESDAPKTTA